VLRVQLILNNDINSISTIAVYEKSNYCRIVSFGVVYCGAQKGFACICRQFLCKGKKAGLF
jgi:hypothetical protein